MRARALVIASSTAVTSLAMLAACSALTSFDGLTGAGEAGAKGDANAIDGAALGSDGASVFDGNAAAVTSYIALFGGDDGNKYTRDIFVAAPHADGTIDAWTNAGALPVETYRGSAAAIGATAYVLPGSTNNATYTSMIQTTAFIDAEPSSFRGLTSFTIGRYRASVATAAGRLVVMGGATSTQNAIADVRWAPVNAAGLVDAWTFGPDLPVQRSSLCGAVSGDFIYALGGSSPTEGGPDTRTASVFRAQIQTDGTLSDWTQLGSLAVATQSCAAAVMNGNLYVTGGYPAGNQNIVQYAPISADGSLGTWASTGAMNHGRALHGMVAIGDRLYVIGGDNGNPLASVESARPDADGSIAAWTDTTPLPGARAGGSAITFAE